MAGTGVAQFSAVQSQRRDWNEAERGLQRGRRDDNNPAQC